MYSAMGESEGNFRFCLGELRRRQDIARLRLSETSEAEDTKRHTRRQLGASCNRGRTDPPDTGFQLRRGSTWQVSPFFFHY